MKTLDQIDGKLDVLDAKTEKRTPISSLPFSIGAAGSYYLTGNLEFTAESGNAITISANNVTLDLNGFTLSSTAGVTGDAIIISSGVQNFEVKNGAIAGNTTVTIGGSAPNNTYIVAPAGFSRGIDANTGLVENCHFSRLRISGCRAIGLDAGFAAVIDHVSVTQNGSGGIQALGGSISHSSVEENFDGGISASTATITNCVVRANSTFGIAATGGSVTNSTSRLNGTVGILISGGGGGTVTNSSAGSNGSDGIVSQNGASITNCTATANGSNGILASNGVIAFCSASGNNTKNNGSSDINATGATRTGNFPTP
jgi:hypothetical protein